MVFVSVILFPLSVNRKCAHPFRCLCHTPVIIRSPLATATLFNQNPAPTSRTDSFFVLHLQSLGAAGPPHSYAPTPSGSKAEQEAALSQRGWRPRCSCWLAWRRTVRSQKLSSSSLYQHQSVSTNSSICSCPQIILLFFLMFIILV